jgi:hypothetical protein
MSPMSTRYNSQTIGATAESGDSSDSEDSHDDNGKPRGQIRLHIHVWKCCSVLVNFLFADIQWNLYSPFSSGVWKRNSGSGKTIDAGAIVEIGFAQGP